MMSTIKQRRMRRAMRGWRLDLLIVLLAGVMLYGLQGMFR